MKPGDLVRLVRGPGVAVAYGNDLYGVITKIVEEDRQVQIWQTCLVMWKGRAPVNEFLDNLELLSEPG